MHLSVALTRSKYWFEIIIRIAHWGRESIFILIYLRKRLIIRIHVFSCINIIVYGLFQIYIVDLLDLKELILIYSPRIRLNAIVLIISDLFFGQLKSSLTHWHRYFIMLVQAAMRSYCFQSLLLRFLFTWISRPNILSLFLAAYDLNVFLLFLYIYKLISTAHIVSLYHLLC